MPEIVCSQAQIEIETCSCNDCIGDVKGNSLALPRVLQATRLARNFLSDFDTFQTFKKLLRGNGFLGPHPGIDLRYTNSGTGVRVTGLSAQVQELVATTFFAEGIDDYRGVKKYLHSHS